MTVSKCWIEPSPWHKNNMTNKTDKTRGEDFAESMTPKNYKDLIEWAESEIREYKKFIKIIKGKLNEK